MDGVKNPSSNVPRPRKRFGPLRILFRYLIIGFAAWMLMLAVFAPWNFFYGGHFHVVPGWQGGGWLHSPAAGGDYFLWVRIGETIPNYRKSSIKGVAYLCSPRGERFRLRLIGNLPKNPGTDLTGQLLRISINNTLGWSWNFTNDTRPSLEFTGSFGDSELIMNDHGSLVESFGPDGALRKPSDPKRNLAGENIQVTFKEGSPWNLSPACPALNPYSP